MTDTVREPATVSASRPAIIDCDIHNVVPSAQALFPYLTDHWREYLTHSAFKGPIDTVYPTGAPTTAAPGTTPPNGGPPGSDLALIQQQVLDAQGIEYGILNCTYEVESVHNPDSAAAMARAVNDWQVAEWLEQEPRLRASLVVPSQHPELAAQEIDRLGDHPSFVQVFLPVRAEALYGTRRYHPIYAAAVRHDLVIGLHFGGSPGNPPTAAGWPSYYVEEYVGMAQIFQSQVLSMIVEGVFDQFPDLRVALIESGATWLPGFMWRLDKEWKGLRREVPWTKQLPSEYIIKHMRATTQPLDTPPDAEQFQQVFAQMGSDELLMYASDYPHRHDDVPPAAFTEQLPTPLRQQILADNARAFYRF